MTKGSSLAFIRYLDGLCDVDFAILMELSVEWETDKRCLNMDVENDDSASEQN